MSHFTVLLITKDEPTEQRISDAMMPFHEFECTGYDKFIVAEDRTEEFKGEYQETDNGYQEQYPTFADFVTQYHGVTGVRPKQAKLLNARMNNGEPVVQESDKFIDEQAKFGWAEIDDDENVIQVITRTNPNKKWDWFVVGGRWSGFLINKKGKLVDSCQFKDLDFEAKKVQLRKNANDVYDKLESMLCGVERTWRSFSDVMADESLGDLNQRREFYRNQPEIIAINTNGNSSSLLHFFSGVKIDDLLKSREDFAKEAEAEVFKTYNVLDTRIVSDDIEDQWLGGSMGWFGCGAQEDDWSTKYRSILDSIQPDDYVTVIDCHI